MNPVEIRFIDSQPQELQVAINELAKTAATPDVFFDEWLWKRREKISITAAIDVPEGEVQSADDEVTPDPTAVICLFVNNKEVAELYYLKSDLAALYPDVVPVDRHILGYGRYGRIKLDEEEMKRCEERLGFEVCYALMDSIAPREALVPFALSYALSDGGSISAEPSRNSWLYSGDKEEDEEVERELNEEGLSSYALATVSAYYQSCKKRSGTLPGWGTSIYVKESNAKEAAERNELLSQVDEISPMQ